MSTRQTDERGIQKGVIPRLFGVLLIFVGTLDAMLSWRAAVALEYFYIFLVAAGLVFYVYGGIRRSQSTGKVAVDRDQVTAPSPRVKQYMFREGGDL
ncbi:MAG: hypothetical protein HOO19_11145 [Rhodospirillaceae bacterium]|jgi:hypothetical protein|nr:hypothetical protein [Rhodospirillaceae bacterium]MBT3883559.1 hypothetical protein [Rhodospirillaceae bacterium]MBT4117536.1 hypothetical protein [Rhodospirillaceae bacterium]MBT4670633.1 hypothetical protein [Rhodospirillaceae bacterium]MBT4721100.1 hypothetical protein [Rhodospirillaceae bacterium]